MTSPDSSRQPARSSTPNTIHPPAKTPQSPPAGDDADRPTWDAVYAVIDAILGTTGQTDKGTDLAKTRSADINYLRATSVGPAPNYLDLAPIVRISENFVTVLVTDASQNAVSGPTDRCVSTSASP